MHSCVPIHQQLLVQAPIELDHSQLQPFSHNGDEISDEGYEDGNEKEGERWGHVVCSFSILNGIHIMYGVCTQTSHGTILYVISCIWLQTLS